MISARDTACIHKCCSVSPHGRLCLRQRQHHGLRRVGGCSGADHRDGPHRHRVFGLPPQARLEHRPRRCLQQRAARGLRAHQRRRRRRAKRPPSRAVRRHHHRRQRLFAVRVQALRDLHRSRIPGDERADRLGRQGGRQVGVEERLAFRRLLCRRRHHLDCVRLHRHARRRLLQRALHRRRLRARSARLDALVQHRLPRRWRDGLLAHWRGAALALRAHPRAAPPLRLRADRPHAPLRVHRRLRPRRLVHRHVRPRRRRHLHKGGGRGRRPGGQGGAGPA
mmetsp:Transcript_25458/g.75632  ORF Transcript_25458/g.75632 Transcript_25458/m.75632 type:complete len:280 (+) Transcript_25458:2-841(+)